MTGTDEPVRIRLRADLKAAAFFFRPVAPGENLAAAVAELQRYAKLDPVEAGSSPRLILEIGGSFFKCGEVEWRDFVTGWKAGDGVIRVAGIKGTIIVEE